MTLSILICSLNSRAHLLAKLFVHLQSQIKDATQVEVLVEVDNKQFSTGVKRNKLLLRATGKYVVFIDDDDWVPDYYVGEMLLACEKDCDCIAINGIMTTNGAKEIRWNLAKDNDNITIDDGELMYLRKTNHITAIKREHSLKCMFPDRSNAEDKHYSENVNKYLKTEAVVDRPMYHYRYSSKNKEYK